MRVLEEYVSELSKKDYYGNKLESMREDCPSEPQEIRIVSRQYEHACHMVDRIESELLEDIATESILRVLRKAVENGDL